jgi:putative membrane protein
MMHWGDYGWGWGMGFGWLSMIIFWVLVIMGIVFIVRMIAGGEKKNEAALDILKMRYAKGEISKEEFDAKKKDIQ